MVWMALWQVSVPMMAYSITETKAYLDFYNVDEKPDSYSSTDHITRFVEAWE